MQRKGSNVGNIKREKKKNVNFYTPFLEKLVFGFYVTLSQSSWSINYVA